jgi:hypothetical protein
MKRNDQSPYLLYIEPKKEQKSDHPVEDELLYALEKAMEEALRGSARYSDLEDNGSFREGSGYRGSHTCDDGKSSDNHDYLLPNGLITNSLAPYYLAWYRRAVPMNDIKKLEMLRDWYRLPQETRDSMKNSKELWDMYARDGESTSKGIIKSFGEFRKSQADEEDD